MQFKTLTTLALGVVLATSSQAASLFFNNSSDTVALNFDSVLGNTMTIEAVFAITGSGGLLFNEHKTFLEDKQVGIDSNAGGNYGFAFPNGSNILASPNPITTNAWHHIAYVLDGTQQRLFIDGILVANGSASQSIGNSTGSKVALGALLRDDNVSLYPSFVGYLDSFRISSAALYTSNFTAPTGDLAATAQDLLLLNFNEGTGTTLTNLSTNQIVGTLGGPFFGATLPEWQVTDPFATANPGVPEPSTLALAATALAVLALKRRH